MRGGEGEGLGGLGFGMFRISGRGHSRRASGVDLQQGYSFQELYPP